MISERRAVAIARPRQIAMYLAKRLTTRSLLEIGRKFGNRDHSTVIHAVKRIEELRGKDVEIDTAVRTLMRTLEGWSHVPASFRGGRGGGAEAGQRGSVTPPPRSTEGGPGGSGLFVQSSRNGGALSCGW